MIKIASGNRAITPEQFCYWLQGFAELNAQVPNEAQWQSIRDHLQKVFQKVTPTITKDAGKVDFDFKTFPPIEELVNPKRNKPSFPDNIAYC